MFPVIHYHFFAFIALYLLTSVEKQIFVRTAAWFWASVCIYMLLMYVQNFRNALRFSQMYVQYMSAYVELLVPMLYVHML